MEFQEPPSPGENFIILQVETYRPGDVFLVAAEHGKLSKFDDHHSV